MTSDNKATAAGAHKGVTGAQLTGVTAAAAKLATELAAKAEFVAAATGSKFNSLEAESATKDSDSNWS